MQSKAITKEYFEANELKWNEFQTYKIQTPIQFLDIAFPEMYLGDLYMISAPTGIGKTTFLLATAKRFCEKTKILYATTEESDISIIHKYLNPWKECYSNFHLIESDDWKTIVEYAKEYDIHYIFYDYLGSTGDIEWKEMKNDTVDLARYAKDNKWLLFVAAQADEKLKDKNADRHSVGYISFSHHTADKAAGGLYLCPENGRINAYVFKYRHTAWQKKPIPVPDLDYHYKEWK